MTGDQPKFVFVGSDHAGFALKSEFLGRFKKTFPNLQAEDMGCPSEASCDYPEFAAKVGHKVAEKNGLGILICGSGIGMSIAANKIRGIRAAVAWDENSARLSRLHNGANILCLGARLLSLEKAWATTETFLKTDFEGGRHERRIDLIKKLENTK